ncbi:MULTISPECIES: DUF2157 domain-containing protein [Acinetobacter]|uniref:DUF2157 domain-containing protein n=1 Tax=Acinetobacter TaxID=469 RepID=UPI0005136099|nr:MULTISPECIES: DUF2157 domain-containing protein [Acinetobacter]KGH51509.1 hypothetical protein GS19_01700 [Acinetobacter idrijaensis]MEB6678725.1 DUF2157 domain-containing protein [Acinetobacter lwoffii]
MHKTELIRNNQFSPLLFCNVEVLRYLKILGLALITVSLLYLMAANWWMLPDPVQLAIPMLILLCSATASIYFDQQEWVRQSLDTVSGLMLGLSLAMIGQIYQTGADSYLLFLLWSALLLPWLYRSNIGIFVMLCVVSQLTLYLYFKQSFWMGRAEGLYLLGLNLLTALSFAYAMRYYALLRFLFIAFVIVISISSMMQFIHHSKLIYLASSVVLPTGAAFYFYRKHQALEVILLIAGLAASVSLWVFELVENQLTNSATGLFVLAVLIFGWFALISFALNRIFPQTKFSVIPLALGAWISGIILAVLLLTYWEAFSILMGIIFIGIAWKLLGQQASVFMHQFAYCLWICGQAAVLIHTELLTDSIVVVWLLQLLMLGLTTIKRMHWSILTLQLLMTHALAIVVLVLENSFKHDDMVISIILSLNYVIFIGIFLTARYWQSSHYQKSIFLWMIAMLTGSAVVQAVTGLEHWHSIGQISFDQVLLFYILPSLLLFSFIWQNWQQFSEKWLWLIPVLGLLLILLGYFEIFIIMLLMAWAVVYQQRLMQALSILLLIFWLWLLYYNLGLSFLFKSVSIFASGVLVLLLAYVLSSPKFQLKAGVVS